MLDKVIAEPRAAERQRTAFDVEIAAVATAVPPNCIRQEEIKTRILEYFPQFAELESVYTNAAIDTRYYCETPQWYMTPHSWEDRTESFQRHALDLLERVTLDALDQAGLGLRDIDCLVVNSTTGLAVPSLDAMLMNRLDFSPHLERFPTFGFGCGGGVAGVARSARIAQTIPGSNVLFLTVDLCTLSARIDDQRAVAFVSGALFGDGAAGVVLRNRGNGSRMGDGPTFGRIRAMGEYFWRDTEYLSAWDVRNDGFAVILGAELPTFAEKQLGKAVDDFLTRAGMSLREFAGYVVHPGGAKVMDVIERVMSLPPHALKASRETLRNYGNMSSPTVLFVLKHVLDAGKRGRHLMTALGPGFSSYFMAVDL